MEVLSEKVMATMAGVMGWYTGFQGDLDTQLDHLKQQLTQETRKKELKDLNQQLEANLNDQAYINRHMADLFYLTGDALVFKDASNLLQNGLSPSLPTTPPAPAAAENQAAMIRCLSSGFKELLRHGLLVAAHKMSEAKRKLIGPR
eukprot:GHVQ01041625.1.p1 GENE.GHVQ01041625.1~~GHVQ01041625.1.p1  ORF type:complete len:146 (+),score=23.37 GHVQ01041625.1:728-1165(+)